MMIRILIIVLLAGCQLQLIGKHITASTFTNDGKYFVTGSSNGIISLFKANAPNTELKQLDLNRKIEHLKFDIEGKYLLAINKKSIKIIKCEVDSLQQITSWKEDTVYQIKNPIFSIASSNHSTVSSNKILLGHIGKASLWELKKGRLTNIDMLIYKKNRRVFASSFSSDNDLVALGGGDNMIQLFNWNNAKRKYEKRKNLEGHLRKISALKFIGTEKILSGDFGGNLLLHDVNSNDFIRYPKKHKARLLEIYISEDWTKTISVDKERIAHWNVEGNTILAKNIEKASEIVSLSYSSDYENEYLILGKKNDGIHNIKKYKTARTKGLPSKPINDDNRIKSEKDISQSKDSTLLHSYALIFAIDDYKEWNNLTLSVAHANELKKTLEQYNFQVELVKSPDKATINHKIRAYIDSFKTSFPRNSQLLICFSGHGTKDDILEQGYFIPSDAKKDSYETYMRFSNLRDDINKIPCNNKLLIIDACHSHFFNEVEFVNTKGPNNNGFPLKSHHSKDSTKTLEDRIFNYRISKHGSVITATKDVLDEKNSLTSRIDNYLSQNLARKKVGVVQLNHFYEHFKNDNPDTSPKIRKLNNNEPTGKFFFIPENYFK